MKESGEMENPRAGSISELSSYGGPLALAGSLRPGAAQSLLI